MNANDRKLLDNIMRITPKSIFGKFRRLLGLSEGPISIPLDKEIEELRGRIPFLKLNIKLPTREDPPETWGYFDTDCSSYLKETYGIGFAFEFWYKSIVASGKTIKEEHERQEKWKGVNFIE